MRKTIIALAMLATVVAGPAVAAGYCKGYQDGYRAGFCAVKQPCYNVSAPGCPSGSWNRNTYEDGYSRGYAAGAAAARRS